MNNIKLVILKAHNNSCHRGAESTLNQLQRNAIF